MLVLLRVSSIRFGSVASASPTENKNAPLMGCESTDTALQATTYVPSSSVAWIATDSVSLPPDCVTSPTASALPSLSTNRIASTVGVTSSVKVSTISVGAVGSTELAAGVDADSSA